MSNVNDITSIALIIAGIVVVAIVGIGFALQYLKATILKQQ